MDKKYYKIVYGYNEGDYLPITSDELHKAQILAIEGGSAIFEAGFFNNRGNDVMRIVPDWHRVRGWNRGYKMETLDYEDVQPLIESYDKTFYNSKKLTDYIIKNNRRDLLAKPASEAFQEVSKLITPESKKMLNETKQLVDNFKVI